MNKKINKDLILKAELTLEKLSKWIKVEEDGKETKFCLISCNAWSQTEMPESVIDKSGVLYDRAYVEVYYVNNHDNEKKYFDSDADAQTYFDTNFSDYIDF